jgi:murein L,D-transpeptidase YafK
MKLFRGANVIRAALLLAIFVVLYDSRRRMIQWETHTHFTVQDRLTQYEPTAGARVKAFFDAANIAYPPAKLVLVGLKTERELQVYAPDNQGVMRFVHAYPILAASGGPGPKLREGDGQVPEGIYKIDSLNPNSLYHLALRVGYPNEWDQAQALKDGRKDLGGDIMIHGAEGSVGCLAMGDPVSEDIFVLAAKTGIENIRLILSPVDFRARGLPAYMPHVPAWTGELYANLKAELAQLPEPREK